MKYAHTLTAALIAGALSTTFALAANADQSMDHGQMDHSKMNAASVCGMPMGDGVINALDIKKSKVTISHKPIEAIGWSEMTMGFSVMKPVDLSAFAAGERVHFLLKEEKGATYSIAAMCSLDADQGIHEACMAKMHNAAMTLATAAGKPCQMEDMGSMDGMDHGSMDDMHGAAEPEHKGHH